MQTVCSFSNGNVDSSLGFAFTNLVIEVIHDGILLKQMTRDCSYINIYKAANSELITMEMPDNLVFNFSFHFAQSKVFENYTHKMLAFLSSIRNINLQLDFQKLVLYFNLSSRDKNLNVGLRHIYSGLTE
ncbi:hypothetical protein [Flagellimonas sp.]|uniref:hypothetical protein n=1 Tax=Flagellimonas sp. TaxID=2058762 RepID=UPI003B599595